MWLVNTHTLHLEQVASPKEYEYAILSHRWEQDEIVFEDMKDLSSSSKVGLKKIIACCELASSLNFRYVWVDTCCIDKKSSAELSEAINSMFNYYKNAKLCLAFLSDVRVTQESPEFERQFRASVWFTRSWTLQELIAPRQRLVFFNAKWKRIGSKFDLLQLVSDITSIDQAALMDAKLADYSIAERMSWASRRQATRVEDLAYSLMGIFDINMPMLYGEGPKAFRRLQEHICNESDDETIFAWSLPPDDPDSDPVSGLLAPSPSAFEFCQGLRPIALHQQESGFTSTNRGLSSKLLLATYRPWYESHASRYSYANPNSHVETYLAFLNAAFTSKSIDQFVGIFLRRAGTAPHNYVRVFGSDLENPSWLWTGPYSDVWCWKPRLERIAVRHKGHSKIAVLPKLIGMELSSILTNSAFQGAKVNPAPSASFIQTTTRIARTYHRSRSGPICTIRLNGAFHNILWIYLGILDTHQPFCIIVDDKFATRPDIKASKPMGSRVELLPTLNDVVNFNIDETQISWTIFNEDLTMSSKQIYTGFWAIKGSPSGTSEWTCLQPSWLGAPYKKDHASWTVRFAPYHDSYHELWQCQIEEAKTKAMRNSISKSNLIGIEDVK